MLRDIDSVTATIIIIIIIIIIIFFMNPQLQTINKTKTGSQKILRSSELAAYNY